MAAKRSRASAERVETMARRRDVLDADQAARREREDGALGRWADLDVQSEQIAAARDEELNRLDEARVGVQDGAKERLSAVAAEQAAVLLELSEDGRTVRQLGELFDLPMQQVRAMLRVARVARSGSPSATQGVEQRSPSPTEPTLSAPSAGGGSATATVDAPTVTNTDGDAGSVVEPRPDDRDSTRPESQRSAAAGGR